MEIIDLRQAPEHRETLALWHFQEWGYLNPGKTLDDYQRSFDVYFGEQAIPTMLIAVEGNQLLGSSSLIVSDMDTHPDLSPWLANVFVAPEARGKGLGDQLVRAVMDMASALNLERIYLFTPDQQDFYTRRGWQLLMREQFHRASVSIMQLEFSRSATANALF